MTKLERMKWMDDYNEIGVPFIYATFGLKR